jgi:predicted NBD/HSP70 family sugar kinase
MGARSRILARERVATPRGDYQAALTAIAGLVNRLEAQAVELHRAGLPGHEQATHDIDIRGGHPARIYGRAARSRRKRPASRRPSGR